jgi:hypothetical protein
MAIIVSGEKIDESEIQQEAERLRPSYEKAFDDMDTKEREAQLFEWSKENVIERTLFRQEISNCEPALPKDKIDSIFAQLKDDCKDPQDFYKKYGAENDEQVKENINHLAKVQLKFGQIYKNIPKPSKEEIRRFYEENKEHFKTAEQVKVGLIVKNIDWNCDENAAYESICKVFDAINNGFSFETLFSQNAGPNNRIDFISRGKLPEEIESVIFNLEPGQVSNIFRSRCGYHIAKVYEKKHPETAELNQVKEHIAGILIKQNQDKAFFDFIDRLKEKAKIEET